MRLPIPLLAVVWLTFATVASPAAAQVTTDEHEIARAHFISGSAHYDRGAYEDAIREFETAYEIAALPEILYNLYRAHEALGHTAEATAHLERYLTDATDIEDRGLLEERLSNLRARIAAEERAAEEETAARESEQAREPDEEPDNGAPIAQPTVPVDAPPVASSFALPAIVSFVGAAVGLVTFGVFAGLTAAEDSRLADDCGADVGGFCTEASLSTLHAYALIADIGLGVAALGAVLGTVFVILDAGQGDSASVAVRVGPGGLSLRGAF